MGHLMGLQSSEDSLPDLQDAPDFSNVIWRETTELEGQHNFFQVSHIGEGALSFAVPAKSIASIAFPRPGSVDESDGAMSDCIDEDSMDKFQEQVVAFFQNTLNGPCRMLNFCITQICAYIERLSISTPTGLLVLPCI